MSRLIDADKLDIRDDNCGCAYDAKIIIKNAPTVDAVEVVHGEWILTYIFGEDPIKCSVCGNSVSVFGYSFCPICGAKMDEKSDGIK